MDIRIECEELPEGGFRAYVYKIMLAGSAVVRGKELYDNTKRGIKTKMEARLSGMIDALLPADKPKEK